MHAPESDLTYDTKEQFELNLEPQDAVFYVSFGWDGGPAGAPVLNLESGRPVEYEGTDIYLDDESYEKVDQWIQAQTEPLGSLTFKVSANVTLLPDASGDIMLPPETDDGEPVFESRGYVALQINELHGVLPVDNFGRKPE